MFGISNEGGGRSSDSLKGQWAGAARARQAREATMHEYRRRGEETSGSEPIDERDAKHTIGKDPRALAFERHFAEARTFLMMSPSWLASVRAQAFVECRVELEFFSQGKDGGKVSQGGTEYTDEQLLADHPKWIEAHYQLILPERLEAACKRLADRAIDAEVRMASQSAIITSGDS